MKAGQIVKLPRLFVAQPLNCSPIDASFQAGVDTPVAREVRKTIAEGTAIKRPMRLREIIAPYARATAAPSHSLRRKSLPRCGDSPDRACSPSPLARVQRRLWTNCPSLASSRRARAHVVIVTGTGLKAASTVADLVQ